jgi:alpha-L-fucosidase
LGVGPGPDGMLTDLQISRLKEIGDWLKVNGQAIYGTRTAAIHTDNTTLFTQGKRGEMFAIVPLDESQPMPAEVTWHYNVPANGRSVKLLMTGKKVKWKRVGDRVTIYLPEEVQKVKSYAALAFSFTTADEN